MSHPLTTLGELVLPAATARFVLLANHVLTAAPPATQRLKAHAGRVLRVEVQGWRLPVPPPPPLVLRISPAGLLEQPEEAAESLPAQLNLRVDASNPLDSARRLATGEMPSVQIEGDVALAADMNWVLANVRWDVAADLERVCGPTVAEGLSRVGEQAAAGARALMQGAASVLRRG